MDELAIAGLIRNTAIWVSIIGILTGVDLLLGVRGINSLKKILDKAIDVDKMIINGKGRVVLGVLFLVISAFMLLLLRFY